MARGLSRELSQQKNVKKTQAGNKGNQEGLTATQRAERDAKVLQEKAAAKAASKAAALAEGGAAAEKAKADEARKQAQRDAKKERAYANTQVAKQNAKLGVADPAARDFKVGGDKDGKPPKDPNKPKLSKEEKIKRAAEAAMKAAAAGSAPKMGKDKAEPDPPAAAADEPEPGPEPADEEEEGGAEEGEVDPAERAAAVAAEEAAARAQREAGGLVLKRLRGEPGLCAALAWSPGEARRLSFHQFCTFGAPDAAAAASDGVLYYELVVGEGLENPQVGFATDGFESGRDYYDGDGVGDCSHSWGIDGTRCARWHEGDEEYDFEWAAGDVIGLAANRATGHFAVSRNGAWGGGGAGVLFSDAGLRCEGGVFPVVSAEAGSFEVRLPDAASGFAHSPPPVDFWGE